MTTRTHNPNGSSPAMTGGWFKQGLRRVAAGRELQARRIVNDTLLSFDDATLAAHGIDRKSISREFGARHLW